jgi:hypothetical protein
VTVSQQKEKHVDLPLLLKFGFVGTVQYSTH